MEINIIHSRRIQAGLVLFLLLHGSSPSCAISYVSAQYGYFGSQQDYIEDSAEQQSAVQGLDLNLTAWRRQRTGYLARGPRLQWQQAQHWNQIALTLPLYQWTADHGAFFEYDYQQWQMNTSWSQNRIYLQENGNATTTGIGESRIESEQVRYQLYWYEGVNEEGPINRVGISYIGFETPATANITGINADIFDATFSGWGIQLGRIKQDPGLNFQWRVNIHNIQTDFSNAVTQHRSNALSESQDYRVHLDVSWHYRYRIEPYWYWVPEIGSGLVYQTQSALETETLEHEAYTAFDWYARLGLQLVF